MTKKVYIAVAVVKFNQFNFDFVIEKNAFVNATVLTQVRIKNFSKYFKWTYDTWSFCRRRWRLWEEFTDWLWVVSVVVVTFFFVSYSDYTVWRTVNLA